MVQPKIINHQSENASLLVRISFSRSSPKKFSRFAFAQFTCQKYCVQI